MKRVVQVSVASFLALIAVVPLQAQSFGVPGGGGRPIRVVLSGGMVLPAGDLTDTHDAGFHVDASLLINLGGLPFTLRPELSLSRLKLKDALVPSGGGDVTEMIAALGNIEFPLAGGLYVLAGGGLLSLSSPGSGTDDVSASKFTFDAGAGFRFQLGSVAGYLEARMGTANYDQGKFGFSKAQFIPVSFGLVF